jgi:conjugal transfer ATP-binding protein TraC
MSFKKEEFQALLEREGVADFIWARTWKNIDGTNIGLFEMANDRWGCVFQIFPPVYVGPEVERRLGAFFNGIEIPDKSSVQFFSFASRNLTGFREAYINNHNTPANIEYNEVLEELMHNREEWIKVHSNKNIFSKGNDLRLRNFVNLVAITIPKNKKEGIPFTESELISYFSKVEQGLNDFGPRKFSRREWVALMREILIPDNPMWFSPDDQLTTLNVQCVDNNSVLVLEDETKTIGIGSMITKEEYDNEQLRTTVTKVETNEDKGFFASLFSKKKKAEEEERTAYTKWHAKVYTTKMFPNHVSLFGMTEKFYDFLGDKMSPNIPCPFMLSLIVYYEGRDKIRTEVGEKVKWNLWQTQSLGSAARFFPEILDRAREAEAINEMLHDGQSPIYANWTCTLMDSDLLRVAEYGEILKKEFLKDNWILQEEILIPHWLFIYSLPLNFEPYVLKDLAKRMNTLFTANAAAITPIITGEKGYGDPVLTYIDRGGQIAGVDIFSSPTNYNFIVVGSSGSGKSYTMADFFTNYLMTGAKIRVIDVGRSYIELCELVGGQYIEFTEEASMCLNFFTNIKLDKAGRVHEDEIQTIVPLIALMAMQSVSPEDVSDLKASVMAGYLSQSITLAFEARQRNSGMQDIVEALEQIQMKQKNDSGETDLMLNDLINALYPFGHVDGEYFKYFNGENNLKFRSDFVVIELEEIDSKEQLKSVVLAAIAHAINSEFFLGSREQKKILAIDEAWSIMDNKIVVRFLETMARRIRKYNGASGIITQTIGDFYKNKATRAIFDSSAWKMFLQQSKESIQAATNKGELTLDEGLLALLQTVKTKTPYYSEILVKQDSGAYFIGRLITDPVAHWIYTNHPKDMKEIFDITKRFGISKLDAKLIKGYSSKNKSTIEDEYKKRVENGKLIVRSK